jgi:hypothetical protein
VKTNAANERGGFKALVAVATAAHNAKPAELDAALASVPTAVLLRAAARHRCLGYLRRSVVDAGLRSPPARTIVAALREYAAKAAVQSYATRAQLASIIAGLDEADLPFVLLKGAARLFRGDREAEDTAMFDLDLLVRAQDGSHALAALQSRGYHAESTYRSADEYWARHHHLVPLAPEAPGLPVELHLQLSPIGMLSMPTDWSALERHFDSVTRDGVRATCLDPLGSALHLVIHGAGVKRLHDAIMLARIFSGEPGTLDALRSALAAERAQPVPLLATLAVAAQIAGLPCAKTPQVESYVRWVHHREDLSPYVRDRSQFADAWYGNGGKMWGAGTLLALPDRHTDEAAIISSARFAYRLVGRIITSAVAVVGAR